jgi:hypothetical protein
VTPLLCDVWAAGEEEGVAEKLRALLEDKGAMARTTIVEAPKVWDALQLRKRWCLDLPPHPYLLL